MLKQLFSAFKFFYKKESISSARSINVKTSIHYIIKKLYLLNRKKTNINYQSKPFFAKFLYNCEFSKLKMSLKYLINKIYERVSCNYIFKNYKIDFNKLKNAGFNFNLPIFIINTCEKKYDLKDITDAIEITLKKIKFYPVFLADQNIELIAKKYKCLVLSDVNLKLLEELNKLNLNYNPLFAHYYPITNVDYYSNVNLKIARYVDFLDNKNISYIFEPYGNGYLYLYLKQNEFYFNIKKLEKSLQINFCNNKKCFYSCNDKIQDIFGVNICGISYLCIKISFKKNNKIIFFNTKNIEDYKNKILIEKIEKNKLFNLKIYTKNKKFNDFFNIYLPNKIFNEFYEKNYIKPNFIKYNKIFLCEFLKINYKEIVENSKTYLELYNFIINRVFKIIKDENKILLNSNLIDFNYKLCVNYNGTIKHVYVKKKEEKDFGGNAIVLSNVSVIDYKSLQKPVIIC